jgi:hypothetical protein
MQLLIFFWSKLLNSNLLFFILYINEKKGGLLKWQITICQHQILRIS